MWCKQILRYEFAYLSAREIQTQIVSRLEGLRGWNADVERDYKVWNKDKECLSETACWCLVLKCDIRCCWSLPHRGKKKTVMGDAQEIVIEVTNHHTHIAFSPKSQLLSFLLYGITVQYCASYLTMLKILLLKKNRGHLLDVKLIFFYCGESFTNCFRRRKATKEFVIHVCPYVGVVLLALAAWVFVKF